MPPKLFALAEALGRVLAQEFFQTLTFPLTIKPSSTATQSTQQTPKTHQPQSPQSSKLWANCFQPITQLCQSFKRRSNLRCMRSAHPQRCSRNRKSRRNPPKRRQNRGSPRNQARRRHNTARRRRKKRRINP